VSKKPLVLKLLSDIKGRKLCNMWFDFCISLHVSRVIICRLKLRRSNTYTKSVGEVGYIMHIYRFCTRCISSDSAVVKLLCHTRHAYSNILQII
jgi:hypothetical protein